MAEIDLLFGAYFGYAVAVVLVFIIIIAIINQQGGEEEKEKKYDVEFKNGRYVLHKKRKPKF